MIGDAIQTYSAGDTQPLHPCLFLDVPRHPEQHLFCNLLDACGNVRIMLVQFAKLVKVSRRLAKISWKSGVGREEQHLGWTRLAEQFDEAMGVGLVRGVMETEIIHVEVKGSVGILLDELPNLVDIARLAVRRHPHDLIFTLIDFKAQERGKRAVQKPERMRENHLLPQIDLVAAAGAPSPCYPLSHA